MEPVDQGLNFLSTKEIHKDKGLTSIRNVHIVHGRIQRGDCGSEPPPSCPQVEIIILNTDSGPTREAVGPLGSNCFSKEVCTVLCEICRC